MSEYANPHHNIKDKLNNLNKLNQILIALLRTISAQISNSFVLNSWIHKVLPTDPKSKLNH